MRNIELDDHLGYLVPPGRLPPPRIDRGLRRAMEQHRFDAGLGVPSIPTRYLVTMHTADRAALPPGCEDRLAAALTRHAERAGCLLLGPIEVEFETDDACAPGRPNFWAGFAENDLLVLADPSAAVEVFAKN